MRAWTKAFCLAALLARDSAWAAVRAPEAVNSLISPVIAPLPSLPRLAEAKRELAGFFADPSRLHATLDIPQDLSGRIQELLLHQKARQLDTEYSFVADAIPNSPASNDLYALEPGLALDIAAYFDGLNRSVNAAVPAEEGPLILDVAMLNMRRKGHPLGPVKTGRHQDVTRWTALTALVGTPTLHEENGVIKPAALGQAIFFGGKDNPDREPLWHQSPEIDEDRAVLLASFEPLRVSFPRALENIARGRKGAIERLREVRDIMFRRRVAMRDDPWFKYRLKDFLLYRQKRINTIDYHRRVKTAYELDRGPSPR